MFSVISNDTLQHLWMQQRSIEESGANRRIHTGRRLRSLERDLGRDTKYLTFNIAPRSPREMTRVACQIRD